MNEQDHPLAAPLRLLAQLAPNTPSPALEARLLACFRKRRARRQRRFCRQRRFYGWAASAALGLAALAAFFLLRAPAPAPASAMPGVFISLPYAESGVPLEQPLIVRMAVPAADLIPLGLPVKVAAPGVRVRADFIVGQDGVPRAVRLID